MISRQPCLCRVMSARVHAGELCLRHRPTRSPVDASASCAFDGYGMAGTRCRSSLRAAARSSVARRTPARRFCDDGPTRAAFCPEPELASPRGAPRDSESRRPGRLSAMSGSVQRITLHCLLIESAQCRARAALLENFLRDGRTRLSFTRISSSRRILALHYTSTPARRPADSQLAHVSTLRTDTCSGSASALAINPSCSSSSPWSAAV